VITLWRFRGSFIFVGVNVALVVSLVLGVLVQSDGGITCDTSLVGVDVGDGKGEEGDEGDGGVVLLVGVFGVIGVVSILVGDGVRGVDGVVVVSKCSVGDVSVSEEVGVMEGVGMCLCVCVVEVHWHSDVDEDFLRDLLTARAG